MIDEEKVQEMYQENLCRYTFYATRYMGNAAREAIFWEIVSSTMRLGKILGYTEEQVTADMRKRLTSVYGEYANHIYYEEQGARLLADHLNGGDNNA